MRSNHVARMLMVGLLSTGVSAVIVGSAAPARAADAPAPQAAVAAEVPTDVAPPAAPAAEPERISGKIYKVDMEDKTITVLVAPERGASGRAYKKYKLLMDDKSLILINQQPSTLAGLESGQIVEVGYFKKDKKEVIDTVVVTGKDEE